jgi:hypothetical protein
VARRKPKLTDRSKLDATPPWDQRIRPEAEPTTGPFDEKDEPADELTRVDLGALKIPVSPGLDVRLDVNEAQQVVAATVAGPHGTMQLGVFAAPRNEGIWDDVREEIAQSLRSQRGNPAVREGGPFGTELTGTLRDEQNNPVPVRFVGIDGPRWFLRAMFAGPVALDAAKAQAYEQLLRGVVVVRGGEPLPVREPVPLRLPQGVELPTPEG